MFSVVSFLPLTATLTLSPFRSWRSQTVRVWPSSSFSHRDIGMLPFLTVAPAMLKVFPSAAGGIVTLCRSTPVLSFAMMP